MPTERLVPAPQQDLARPAQKRWRPRGVYSPRPLILRNSRKKCDDDDDDGGANTAAAGRDEQWVNLVHGVRIMSDADDDGFKADGRTQRLDLTSGRIRISVFHRAADCGDQLGGV